MPPRLKSLELHGYKTFASRTEFQFPGIITAIVGPNGSGKSNIADAMRWVLGEQSYTLLRGRKTEDMIFAGSEQRSRAGMASATITFDNEDGWLPIDFSEVAITRRAYRDGQNEYLINGQRVRLREISELLAQSGLAERTYTIIGQGLVDAALALKPEERRRLFEEAAGIGLYRARREDAINRLETTRRNLDRVMDILQELEPRLKSLERQAKRAREYENLRSDLHLLLRDWYGYHWLASQKEVKRTAAALHQQEKRLEQVRQQRSEIILKMVDLRRETGDLRTRLNQHHAHAASLHQQIEQISRTAAIIEERKHSLLEQGASLQQDLVHMENEIEKRTNRRDTVQTEKKRLQAELEESQVRAAKARLDLKSREDERGSIEKNIAGLRQKLVQLETAAVRQSARISELEDRLAGVSASLISLTGMNTSALEEMEQARENLTIAWEAFKEVEKSREGATSAIRKTRIQLEDVEASLHTMLDEKNRLDSEMTRTKTQLDVLVNAQKSHSDAGDAARYLLESNRQGRILGTMLPLTDLITVPTELETAVSSALGDYIDLVILDKESDPEPLLEMLMGAGKGRAAILPSAWIKDQAHSDPLLDGDCLGTAVELISANPSDRPILNAALGQTYIVRTRAAARRFLEGKPAGTRAVTLDGEVFHQNGTVISGKPARGAAQFSRPRDIKDLEEDMAKLIKRQEETNKKIRILSSSRDKHLVSLKTLETELQKTSLESEKVSREVHTLELSLDHASREDEWLQKQSGLLASQKSSIETELASLQASNSGEKGSTEILRKELHEASIILAAIPLAEYQAEAIHWDTSLAVSRRAFEDAEKRETENLTDLAAAIRQAENIRERIQACQVALAQVDVDKITNRQEETKLLAMIQEVNQQAAPDEDALSRLEKELEVLQEEESASQQTLSLAERLNSQAQLEALKARESADNIRRRAEDDFGLVTFNSDEGTTGQEPLPLEGMVEELPALESLPNGLEESITRLRAQIRRMGAINPEALAEYDEVQTRHHFMKSQVADLHQADEDLRQVITELDELMKREFRKTFEAVAVEFHQMFTRLFGGGNARLVLTDEDQPIEAGIDIEARLPGRRDQGLSLLSGGERSLAAVALVFSLLKISPTPFCVLDEVDAMLDEANVGRFRDLLRELSETTQFIVITHNRNTVQAADVIYGVTMGRDSASQVISLKLEEVPQEMAQ